jgi:long-subunit acyl-CoA synthetase (AMP-forming)
MIDELTATLLEHPHQRIRDVRADGIREVTFAQCHEDVVQLCARLRAAGIGAGTVVGIHGGNSYEWLVADLALIHVGCVSVAIPTAYERPIHRRYVSALLSIADDSRDISISRVKTPAVRRLEPDEDVFTLAFSSGSTGTPKAIAISKCGIARTVAVSTAAWGVTAADDVLIVLPFPSYEPRFLAYLAIANGCALTITTPELMFEAAKLGPTFLLAPPSFYEVLKHRVDHASLRYKMIDWLYALPGERWTRPAREWLGRRWTGIYGPQIRALVTSSAPIARELVEEFRRLGQPLYETYGCTELGWIALETTEASGLCIVNGVEVTLDGDGQILACDETPMGAGYVVDDRVEPFCGSFATGDAGTLHDGVLTITGRTKNVIVTSSGVKLNAETMEEAIESHPQVVKAVVAMLPQTDVLACLVWTRESAPEAEIKIHVAKAGEGRLQAVYVRPAAELSTESGLLALGHKINRPAALGLLAELSQAEAHGSTTTNDHFVGVVCATLATIARRPVGLDQKLRGDLGIDSLGLMSAVVLFDERLGLGAAPLAQRLAEAQTVSDVVAVIESLSAYHRPQAQESLQ